MIKRSIYMTYKIISYNSNIMEPKQDKVFNDHIGDQINETLDHVEGLREYCKNLTISNETAMTFKYLILLKEILHTDDYIKY